MPLDVFAVDVTSRVCLDVGASTGGFTDALLQRGAARVYALDVGRAQLAWKLRQDRRVVVMEGVNARYLEPLPEPVDLITVDVAFISLAKVLPAVLRSLRAVRSATRAGQATVRGRTETGRPRRRGARSDGSPAGARCRADNAPAAGPDAGRADALAATRSGRQRGILCARPRAGAGRAAPGARGRRRYR